MVNLKKLIVSNVVMLLVSLFMIMLVSVITYVFRWQADLAMIGITFSYIIAGYCGGICLKFSCLKEEEKSIAGKMLQAMVASMLFVLILLGISFGILGNEIIVDGRLLLIAMLLVGSATLGRII